MRKKFFVGLGPNLSREVFKSDKIPEFTDKEFTQKYLAVIGPFKTKRGAEFCRDYGRDNPHCQCVNDAERLAKRLAEDNRIKEKVEMIAPKFQLWER